MSLLPTLVAEPQIAMNIASMNVSTTKQNAQENPPASSRAAPSHSETRGSSSAATAPGAPSWSKAALGFGASLLVITLIAFGASTL